MPGSSTLNQQGKGRFQIQIDGAARGNPGPAGIGVVLTQGNSRRKKEISTYLGIATNNVAETCALIIALQEAWKICAREVTVLTDSELLAHQVKGTYRVKNPQLQWLHALIQHLIQGFKHFEIRHVPRTQNRQADRLANRAVTEGLKRQPRSKPKPALPATPPDTRQPTFW